MAILSEEIEGMKSLNTKAATEALEKKRKMESLVQTNKSLEDDLNQLGFERADLEDEMNQMAENEARIEIERSLLYGFIETQMVELGLNFRELRKDAMRNEEIVEFLRKQVNQLTKGLAEEKETKSQVFQERDVLNKQLMSAEDEASSFRFAILEFEKKERNSKEEVGKLQDLLEASNKRMIEEVRKIRESSDEELKVKNAEIDNLMQNMEVLKEEKKVGEDERENHRIIVADLQKEVLELNKVIVSSKKDEEQLRGKMLVLEVRYSEVQQQVNVIEVQSKILEKENLEKRKEIEVLTKQKEEDLKAHQLVISEKFVKEKEITSLMMEKEEADKTIASKESMLDGFLKKMEALNGNVISLEASIKDRESTIDGLKVAVVELEKKEFESQEKIGNLKIMLEDSRKREIEEVRKAREFSEEKLTSNAREIEELGAAIEALKGEKNVVQEESDGHKLKLTDLEKEFVELNKCILSSKKEEDALKGKIVALEKSYGDLLENHEAVRTQIANSEKENSEKVKEVERLEKEKEVNLKANQLLTVECKEKEEKLTKLVKENEVIEEAKATKENEVNELQKTLELLKEDLFSLQKIVDDRDGQIDEMKASLVELGKIELEKQEEIEKLAVLLAEVKNKGIEEVTKVRECADKEIQVRAKDIEDLSTIVEVLKKEKNLIEDEKNDHKIKAAGLEREVLELNKVVLNSKNEEEAFRGKISALEKSKAELSQKFVVLVNEIGAIETENFLKKADIERLTDEKETSIKAHERLVIENRDKGEIISKLMKDKEVIETEKAGQASELIALQKILDKLNAEVLATQLTLTRKDDEINELKDLVLRYEKEERASVEEIGKLEDDLKNQKEKEIEEIKKLRDAADDLSKAVEVLKSEKKAIDGEKESCRIRAVNLEKEVLDLNKNMLNSKNEEENLRKKILELETSHGDVLQKHKAIEVQIGDLEKENSRNLKEIERLIDEIEASLKAQQLVILEKKEREEKFSNLMVEKEVLEKEKKLIEFQNNDRRIKVAELEGEVFELKRVVFNSKNEKESLRGKIFALEESNGELSLRHMALQKEIEVLETENSQKIKDIERLTYEKETCTKAVIESELISLQKSLENLNAEALAMQLTLQRKDGEIDDLKDLVLQLEKKERLRIEEIEKLEAELNDQKMIQIEEVKNVRDVTDEKLTVKGKEIDDLSKALEVLKSEKKVTEGEKENYKIRALGFEKEVVELSKSVLISKEVEDVQNKKILELETSHGDVLKKHEAIEIQMKDLEKEHSEKLKEIERLIGEKEAILKAHQLVILEKNDEVEKHSNLMVEKDLIEKAKVYKERELQDLQKNWESLNGNLFDLQSAVKERDTKIDEMTAIVLKFEKKDLESQGKIKKLEVDLENSVKELQLERDGLMKNLDEEKENLKILRKEVKKLEIGNEEKGRDLAKMKMDNEDLMKDKKEMHQTIAALKKDKDLSLKSRQALVEDNDRQIARLLMEKDAITNEKSCSEREVDGLQKLVNNLNGDVVALTTTLTEREFKIEKMTSDVCLQQDYIEKVQLEKDALKKDLIKEKENLTNVSTKLQRIEKDAEDTWKELTKLKLEYDVIINEKKDMESSIGLLKEEKDESLKAHHLVTIEKKNKEGEIAKLVMENEAIHNAKVSKEKEMQNHLDALNGDLLSLRSTIKDREIIIDGLVSDVSSHKNSFDEVKLERDVLKKDLDEERTNLTTLKSQVHKMEIEIAESSNELAKMKSENKSLIKEKKEMTETIVLLEEEKDSSLKAHHLLAIEKACHEGTIAKLIKEKEEVEKENSRKENELQKTLQTLNGDVLTMQSAISERDFKIKELVSNVNTHKGSIEKLHLVKNNLEKDLDAERLSLENLISTVQKMEQGQEETSKELTKMKIENEALIKAKKEMEQSIASLEKEKESNSEAHLNATIAKDKEIMKLVKEKEFVEKEKSCKECEFQGTLNTLNGNVLALQNALNAREFKINELVSDVCNQRSFAEKLQFERDDLRKEFLSEKEKLTILSSKFQKIELGAEESAKELAKTKLQNEDLIKEKHNMETHIALLKTEKESTLQAHERLVEEKKNIEDEITKLLIEKDAKYCQECELQRLLEILSDDVVAHQSTIQNRDFKIEELSADMSTQRDSLEKMELQRDVLKKELADEKENLAYLKREVERIEKGINETAKELSKLNMEIETLMKEKMEFAETNEALMKQNEVILSSLNEAQVEARELREKAESASMATRKALAMMHDIAVSLGDNVHLNGENKVESEIEECALEFETIKEALERKEVAVNEMKKKVDVLQSSVEDANKKKGILTIVSSVTTVFAALFFAHANRRL